MEAINIIGVIPAFISAMRGLYDTRHLIQLWRENIAQAEDLCKEARSRCYLDPVFDRQIRAQQKRIDKFRSILHLHEHQKHPLRSQLKGTLLPRTLEQRMTYITDHHVRLEDTLKRSCQITTVSTTKASHYEYPDDICNEVGRLLGSYNLAWIATRWHVSPVHFSLLIQSFNVYSEILGLITSE